MTREKRLLIFTILLLPLVGALFLFNAALRPLLEQSTAAEWLQAEARLTQLSPASIGSDPFTIQARYEYSVAGRTYAGRRIAPDEGMASSLAYQRTRYEELRAALAAKRPLAVWVNPADAREALLYRDVGPLPWLALAVAFLFLVVLAVEVWAIWFRRT
jgi:hypothetical protein